MKKIILSLFSAALVFAGTASAETRGTADEAKAMVEKTIAMLNEKGKDVVFPIINDAKDSTFHDRDLYVFVVSLDGKGTFLAHGTKPHLVNKNLIGLKDVKGTPFMKNFVKMVQENGEGWVDYVWPDPTKKGADAKTSFSDKSTFVKKYDDSMLIGVGIYK